MKRFTNWILVLIALGVTAILLLVLSRPPAVQHVPEGAQEVTFSAADGFLLHASYWSSAFEHAPAVILIHQNGTDRHDFDSFIPGLLAQKYTVLAYDIRGFGLSTGKADVKDYPQDTMAAIAYLKKQNNVDPKRIGIVGTSIGANLAFVASGSSADVAVAVALSPLNTPDRPSLMGTGLSNFNPHNILIVSDDKEKSDADAIYALCFDPKLQKVYTGAGHGKVLFANDDAVKDVMSFLAQTLNVTPTP